VALISALAALLTAIPPLIKLVRKQRASSPGNPAAGRTGSTPTVNRHFFGEGQELTRATLVLFPILLLGAAALYLVPRLLPDGSTTDKPAHAAHSSPLASTPASTEPSPAGATAPACHDVLTITSPQDGSAFNGTSGVPVTGSVCGLNGRRIWLYDLDSADRYYYPTDDVPVAEVDGDMAYTDAEIGDPGDNHKKFTLTFIAADDACENSLRTVPPVEGDRKFRTIPTGCVPVATLDVLISNP